MEWCYLGYDDTFRVLINGNVVFQTSVDTLCGSGGLIPTGPIDDTPIGENDVAATYKTGWRTATIDLTPYAGHDVTLRFEVQDKGDTIYDTAILIDNIVIGY